jgi:prefoldin subunit 5
MIPKFVRRPLSLFLVFVGLLGMILGAFGLVQTWQARITVESSLLEGISTIDETIEITQATFANIDQTLKTVDDNITNLNSTLLTVGQFLNDTSPVIGNFASLLKDELPTTLEATQTSLETAEASAKLLDSVMRALTAIPFYPGNPYNPTTSLDVTVKNVALSLEDIPQSLSAIGEDLETNQKNLTDLEDELISLSITLAGIHTDISNAKTTLEDYQILLTSLGGQLILLEDSLPRLLDTSAWFITLLISWIMIMQIGLIVQGIVLFETDKRETIGK